MSHPTTAQIIQLVRTPQGLPTEEDFAIAEQVLPALQEGQILVKNRYLSLDAALRIRMSHREDPYLPPVLPGDELDGWAIGTVVESRNPSFAVGADVFHARGWRDFAVLDAGGPSWTRPRILPDVDGTHLPSYLSTLGPTGLTAWAGLQLVAEARAGDVVYVSAAAGGTGSVVVQFARHFGYRIIGSAGTPQKVAYVLDELGASDAFCYKDEAPAEALKRIAPEGIDVYFDMVGGSHLDAALDAMREGGRVAICGAIGSYSSGDSQHSGVHNLFRTVERGLTIRGFLARSYADRWDEFLAVATPLVASGIITDRFDIEVGLEQTPSAFIRMLSGDTVGKSLVRLD